MKFAGELRVPDIDHPGIPATVVIDDTHIEIVLDGESLGKWSLYDVRARRLISKAFALDLAGEEITFLSEEPVDFAYRGVERMAQVWAEFKTMRGPQRMLAVRRSRSAATPSRVGELRAAMEANLAAHMSPSPARREEPAVPTPPSVPPPNRRPAEPSSVFQDPVEVPVQPVEASKSEPEAVVSPDPIAPNRDEEEARKRLEALRQEAVDRDNKRIEAFRAEMAQLEVEKSEAERVAAEFQSNRAAELERLKTEMRVLKEREAGLSVGDTAALETLRAAMERIETHRQSLEQSNLDAVRRLRDSIEAKRAELERQEAARWQSHRREMERIKAEMALLDLAGTKRGETEVEQPGPFADPTPVEVSDLEDVPDVEVEEVPEIEAEESPDVVEPPDVVDFPEVDIDEVFAAEEAAEEASSERIETPVPIAPAAIMSATVAEKRKGGLVGSVKSAFLRDGKQQHEHIFVKAPATLGLTRSICSECGFVSIGAADE